MNKIQPKSAHNLRDSIDGVAVCFSNDKFQQSKLPITASIFQVSVAELSILASIRRLKFLVLIVSLVTFSGHAVAEDDVEILRQQLEQQRSLIEQQRKMLELQQNRIEQQSNLLEQLSDRISNVEHAAVVAKNEKPDISDDTSVIQTANQAQMEAPVDYRVRDSVGDLNAEAIRAGDFPGSFKIPGPDNISLRIGGFVKAVGISDSDAEEMGAAFLPATMGTRSPDENGAYSFDSTLTRVSLDARAPLIENSLRAYVEYDLNDGNRGSISTNMRHAYGVWNTKNGISLTAGHTWSTFMDLKILPEGLTEPTVSGPVFSRQSMLRWTQPINSEWTYHLALEDPSSNDFSSTLSNVRGNTSVPDIIAGIEYDQPGMGHLRLNGLVRKLKVDGDVDDSATAWGVAVGTHLDVGKRDRWNLMGVYGKGLGRYLLGIQPTAGSAVDINTGLELRDNWGAMTSYLYHWSKNLRSNAMAGVAHSDALSWQNGSTFESTQYGAANLMWSPHPHLTLGVEYGYGRLERKDGSDLDNHRIMFGFQYY